MRLSRRSTILLRLAVAFGLAFIYVPLVVIVIYAFNASNILAWPPPGLTLDWFPKALEEQVAREAFVTSIKAATAATAIALALGTLAALAVARYRFFEAVSTDDAAVMTTLAERQYGAALEAYLVTARLFFAAPDLPEKCRRLTRLQELAAGPLTGIAEERLPAAWRPLLPIQAATAARLGGDALAALACSVQPVRGRAETIRIVETRAKEHRIRLLVPEGDPVPSGAAQLRFDPKHTHLYRDGWLVG